MEYGKDVPDRRQQTLVDRPFQFGLARLLGSTWLLNTVVLGGLIYYLYAGPVFRVEHLAGEPGIQSVNSSPPQFAVLLTLGAVLGLALVITIGLHVSHQIAGPLAQLKAKLRQAAEGNVNVELQFRRADYFTDLPEHFNEMMSAFKERARDEIERLRAIEASLDESSPARARLHDFLAEKEALLDEPASSEEQPTPATHAEPLSALEP